MAVPASEDTQTPGKKTIPNVFPLHLAPIDSFFRMDDRPRYAMTSVIHIDFEGEIEAEAFDRGLADAQARHPLLRANVRPAKRNLPCWVAAKDPRPTVIWGKLGDPITLEHGESFNLAEEVGLRFWNHNGDGQSRMTIQVHHACTDGTGVYRFLGDFLAAYAHYVTPGSDPPDFGPIDPRLLRGRRMKMAHLAADASTTSMIRHSLKQAYDVFGKRIEPLAPPQSSAPEPRIPFPGVHTEFFTRDEHKQLREAAGRYGVMLNDLLLAEMFRTIYSWNSEVRQVRDQAWLRIMMPFDMRDKEDFALPASNMTAYTFITRRAAVCSDLKALVRGIRDETAQIKNGRLGSAFIDAIMTAEKQAWVLAYLLGRKRSFATTILSNIGDPSKRFTARLPREGGRVRAGNLLIRQITGVPPLRPYSHATLAIFSYARELAVSVRCDPYAFEANDSRRFLHLYAQALRAHIDE
ncbi:MAG: hypothetical protein KDA60_10185 [Planctomycetales bacterium]|nr:hypothetical protein [Planctomycetales bacterium]